VGVCVGGGGGDTSWTGLIYSIKLYYPKRLGQMNGDSHYSATVCVD